MRIIISLFLFISISTAVASELCLKKEKLVFSKAGNIYYTENSNRITQITHSGKDFSPVLSPNNKMIAFVRTGNQVVPEACDAYTTTKYGNEIWIYDLSIRKKYLLVANNFECDKPEKKIIDPSDLLFSPNNNTLFFITSAWTTSGALHSVKIATKKHRYITPANEVKVVSKGEYKGHLIVNQHRYFIGGGSYDWYWLINTEGKEEGPLGPEITNEQMNFINSNA